MYFNNCSLMDIFYEFYFKIRSHLFFLQNISLVMPHCHISDNPTIFKIFFNNFQYYYFQNTLIHNINFTLNHLVRHLFEFYKYKYNSIVKSYFSNRCNNSSFDFDFALWKAMAHITTHNYSSSNVEGNPFFQSYSQMRNFTHQIHFVATYLRICQNTLSIPFVALLPFRTAIQIVHFMKQINKYIKFQLLLNCITIQEPSGTPLSSGPDRWLERQNQKRMGGCSNPSRDRPKS